jgi:isocitrate lyase
MAIVEADAQPLTPFEQDVAATQRYFDSPRFEGIIRLYTARQVVEQRGTIPADYTVARETAEAFYFRPLLAGAGGDHEADGHRGHLPRWMGDFR